MDGDSSDGQDDGLSEVEEEQEREQTDAEVVHLLKRLLDKLQRACVCGSRCSHYHVKLVTQICYCIRL